MIEAILWDLMNLTRPGEPGFGPGLTDPESVVLPLHYSPIVFLELVFCLNKCFFNTLEYISFSPFCPSKSIKVRGFPSAKLAQLMLSVRREFQAVSWGLNQNCYGV